MRVWVKIKSKDTEPWTLWTFHFYLTQYDLVSDQPPYQVTSWPQFTWFWPSATDKRAVISNAHCCKQSADFPKYLAAGPDLLSASRALFRKKVGPFNWGGKPYFSEKKTGDFFGITVCQLSLLLKNWRHFLFITLLFARGGRPFFPHEKILLLLWGPLFVGRNMLNMPKSAAAWL